MNSGESVTSVLDSALKLGKPVVETACRLFESLLGEPCKVAGGMLADQVYAWRWRNRIRILNKAKEILQKNNVAARAVPPGFLLPLLEAGGDVEEPSLQEMWARLLASGVSDSDAQHPAFIKTLAQLSPLEAHLLQVLWRIFLLSHHPGWPYEGGVGMDSPAPGLGAHENAIENLCRLGLCECSSSGDLSSEYTRARIQFADLHWQNQGYYDPRKRVWFTNFGAAFARACMEHFSVMELVERVGMENAIHERVNAEA